MEEHHIGSVQDLLALLQNDSAATKDTVWYRGQADARWELLPGYLRLSKAPSEATLLKRFKQSAAMLIDMTPQQSFDWLFLLQHYGVPTRLLDWSESPLVALYFAVEDSTSNVDGALWQLRPSALNKNAHINNEDEDDYIPSFEDEELSGYSVESLSQNRRLQLLPVATIATRNNARIQAQLGVFTIHHREQIPIERVGDSSHIVKYTIPATEKEKIARQLRVLGISRFQLFPELASVGAIVKGGLK